MEVNVINRLHWVAPYLWSIGCRQLWAPVAGGVYDIIPRTKRVKHNKEVLVGFEVRFLTTRPEYNDNPLHADEDAGDIRVIATDVQSETEAKAIAQADYSSR
jgi:hypothetical protein